MRYVVVCGLGLLSGLMVAQTPRYQSPINAPVPQNRLILPVTPAISPGGTVVEDVVVRVNDQIISRSDVQRSQEQLEQELQQSNATPADAAERQTNMLRDMIDQQLLLSRAKELGLNADAEVIRRLDEIRKQNKLDTMEDLEKAARQQGVSFEDFKANIRNGILTQQVVRDEVGRRLQMTQAQEQAFYDAHKGEFTQPEQVRLSEILVPTPADANDATVAQAQAKASALEARLKTGAKFEDVAKSDSGGPTAAQGGELGEFKRGALAKVLEDQTFGLKAGEFTAPVRTRQGFVILKVTAHTDAGVPPLKEVEPQVQEAMYMDQMQPALRAYLTKLREDAYIDIKPGFVDAGSSTKQTKPVFTAYAPPVVKRKKTTQKQRFDRGGRFSTAKGAGPATAGAGATAGVAAAGAPILTPPGGAGAGAAAVTATPVAASVPVARATPVTTTGGEMAKITRGKKVKREKIRFGQAPRTALPSGTEQAGLAHDDGLGANHDANAAAAPAPGTVIAPLETASVSGSGSGSANVTDVNPLAPVAGRQAKTRYSARAKQVKAAKVAKKDAKVQEKVIATAAPETADEKLAAQTQAAPLGLSGDTAKKQKKVRVKGAPKERLADRAPTAPAAKPEETPSKAADRGTVYEGTAGRPKTQPTADRTTLPAANAPSSATPPQGTTDPATPGKPIGTPPPQ